MDDMYIVDLWAQLAFKQTLNDQELELLNNCAKHLLKLLEGVAK